MGTSSAPGDATIAVYRPDNVLSTSLKALVVDGLSSKQSRRAYGRAIDEFLVWFQNFRLANPSAEFTKSAIQAYRAELLATGASSASINLKLSAIRRLAVETSDNGMLAIEVANAIRRVQGVKAQGVRTGNWLTVNQAEQLIQAPDLTTLKGKRDRALLCLLIGCGVRREETSSLDMQDIQQRDGRWAIVDIKGKGGRIRSVPMPAFAKASIDIWALAGSITSGRVFRRINKGGRICGDSMTAQSIFETVKHYAALIGVENVAPHDLRRTFAKLAHKGNSPLEQIQLSLGHASIQTTERYLGVKQDFTDAPCDHLGLKLNSA